MLAGATVAAATTGEGKLVADVEPPVLLAVTTTRIVEPASVDCSV
jgi:hypothetical protein